jgi:ribosomal protein S18 acetylase RimI-like enzyme
MSTTVEFLLNEASAVQITGHLLCCDADFIPPLSGRVEIRDYAKKIASKATRFEAWSGGILVGLVAAYCNYQENHIAYITSVSVLKEWTREGIAAGLVGQCVEHVKVAGMRQISLAVAADNAPAIKLYEKSGFIVSKANGPFVGMNLYFKSGEEHE